MTTSVVSKVGSIAAALLLFVACGGDVSTTPTSPPSASSGTSTQASTDVSTPASVAAAEQVLASGSVIVPAVEGIQDAPGFHEVSEFTATLPTDLRAMSGSTLIVRFRDLTRPDVTCASEHPLSGCVTLDWSDFPERPKVPEGGAFEQRVSLPTVDGTRDLFLSESGELHTTPDPYQPG